MRKILISLFVVASMMATGCAMNPQAKVWAENPTSYEEVAIKWHRNPGKGYLDTEGTCNIQAVDDEDSADGLKVVYAQILKCRTAIERMPVTNEGRKLEKKTVRIYIVPKPGDVEQRMIDFYGWRFYKATMRASGKPDVCGFGTGVRCVTMSGFYMNLPDWSGIVIAKGYLSDVGHELKHVYDGNWHMGAHWRRHARGQVVPGELKAEGVAAK